ncbi:Dps family protein [Paenibacillus alginolyticus]|uniref:DNA starvation/stationary phase protection protein n=1 Tax=Paenibacillus alginolyticus TaxID=59839 RepID=A0ABT4GN31_9BACL|nr:Dps family protein [Paenibacillus alginolyticus]MCY9697609.1 DNA starvation/stationary phase protection protein [Paenibacillus alginolyticus]MEC0145319.1 DNA starvation/stationary phase protection protein [Paenibacillus alginolyticus]
MVKTTTKASPITEILDKQVANFSVLYMKLHNYHWYVKGENFFTLHIKFEELYTEVALHLDVIAERMLSLRTIPTATLQEHLAAASIKEAKNEETAEQMVKQLVGDFTRICSEMTEGIELAEEQKDQPTADLLIGIRSSLEKHSWMLDAYLGK